MASEITVLLIDDDASYLPMAENLLERGDEDLNVVSYSNPQEALTYLDDTDEVDCIVCDYKMPRLDGLNVFEQARDIYPHIPFFLLTAKGDEAIANAALDIGVTDYLQKSDGSEQFAVLRVRIRNAVSAYRSKDKEVNNDTLTSQIVERSPDGLLIFAESDIITINNKLADMANADRQQEIIAQSPSEVVDLNPDSDQAPCKVNEDTYEWSQAMLRTVDGSKKDVEAAATKVPYEDTTAVRVLVRDVVN